MCRTLKSKWARSYAYKFNKQWRGDQKIEDMYSHNSHRITNYNADEVSFVRFNECKFKNNSSVVNYQLVSDYTKAMHNPADLNNTMEDYDWKKETIQEYLIRKISENSSQYKHYVRALKQFVRRGENRRFIKHQRDYKNEQKLF